MREISADDIARVVCELCVEANHILPESLEEKVRGGAARERSEAAKSVFEDLCANLDAARETPLPICQDTGMAVVFVTMGQDVRVTGGGLKDAVNRGVREGYLSGYLRCSVVSDPLERVNTGDNTPAVIHFDIVEGDSFRLDVCPKGFGSENMSALRMMTPASGEDEIAAFVEETVKKAGSNPCPPMVIGVGIGGDFELCALLAKRALCRDISVRNEIPRYRALEQRMLDTVNALGIGPMGYGGALTALAVNIETAPTHIAGLPVAVNIGCHVTRHASREL